MLVQVQSTALNQTLSKKELGEGFLFIYLLLII